MSPRSLRGFASALFLFVLFLGVLGHLRQFRQGHGIRSPGVLSFDLSLSRIFQVTERLQFETRADAFNVINHTNLGNPVTARNASNFGKITSTTTGGIGDPRILQFAAKIRF